MYNFDKLVDRKGTSCVKSEEMDLNFGRSDLMPFWIADMEFQSPDFAIEKIKERADHGVFGYTKRMPDFYKAIQNWLKKRHNLEVAREEIEYGPGVIFLVNMMIRLFTKEDDNIIIQTPVYYPFANVIKGNKRKVVENPLVENNGSWSMNFDDLEKKAKDPKTTMLVLCSPHNPFGLVWPREVLEKLGRICIDNNVLVVSDEIHFDLVYEPNKHIPFASILEEFRKNSITCTAPSKTFNIAGLHSAYCIISDKEKMEKYVKELKLLDLNRSNVFSREVTQVLYEKGETWVDELVAYLKKNMDFVYDYFKENMPKIKPIKMQGTYLMFLDCRELGLSDKELDNFFLDAGLALDSGYWFGEQGRGFMRLNIACPKVMLEDALKKIEAAYKNLIK